MNQIHTESIVTSVATLGVAAVVIVLTHHLTLAFVRISAARALTGRSRWRPFARRAGDTDDAAYERRREARIAAFARVVSRMISIVVAAVAVMITLQTNGVDISVALSGAGFLGLLVAFGAQGSVNDFMTGLHVLLEDRLAEGDTATVSLESGATITGVVTAHGMFGTRIEADGVVHHVANRRLCEVANHSQVVSSLDRVER